jgi:predicted phosphodiesterase
MELYVSLALFVILSRQIVPMRILVISDIHANLVALDSVLADAGTDYQAVWCLGDVVGYGPNPNECVQRVRQLPGLTCLVGNHDKAALGEIDLNVFNGEARRAIHWTQAVMTEDSADYLRSLEAQTQHGEFWLAHGSPRQPIWEYILDRYIARDNMAYFTTPYCLVGHTHVPVIFRENETGRECYEEVPDYGQPRQLGEERLIINPGSVGQPRDGNPEAAYALLDTDAGVWHYRRTAYDVAETQDRMHAAGLPERLVRRLAQGW